MEFNSNSSLTTLFLNGKEEMKPKKHHRHYKSKHEHRRRSDDQRKKNIDSVRSKLITEKIHVERQYFKCIFNLNTTMCDHKDSRQRSDEKSLQNPKSDSDIERIIPLCLRQLCRQPRHHKTGCHSHSKGHSKEPCKEIVGQKEIQKKIEPKFSPKNTLEFEYEDISNKSLDTYMNIPSSYKIKHVEVCKEDNESKLDTLIKRTKERERKLVEQSRKTTPWCTNSPAYTDISSAEFHMSYSENTASLHSRSTLLLEPRDHRYYPPIEGFYRSTNTEGYPPIEGFYRSTNNEGYPQYSPSSPIRNEDYFMMGLETNDWKIKNEPATDIERYSPTQSRDLQICYEIGTPWIKEEIKLEPGN